MEVLPLVSTLAIVAIVAAVVSANSANLMTSGLLIVAVVILHNVLGYALGYVIGKVLKLDETKCRAISIEVGMQNSGLATSLATTHFAQYPWPRFRVRCSAYGTMYPAQSWQTSLPAMRLLRGNS